MTGGRGRAPFLFVHADWHRHGECHGVDPDLWFPQNGGSSKEAKDTCKRCPYRERCLEEAMERNEEFGVWGGLTARERKRLRKERGLADGSQRRGSLTREQVEAIRVEFQSMMAQGVPYARESLGSRYGLAKSSIGLIVTGRSYPDWPGPLHRSSRTHPQNKKLRLELVKDEEAA